MQTAHSTSSSKKNKGARISRRRRVTEALHPTGSILAGSKPETGLRVLRAAIPGEVVAEIPARLGALHESYREDWTKPVAARHRREKKQKASWRRAEG